MARINRTIEQVIRSDLHWLRGQGAKLKRLVDGEQKCETCGRGQGVTGRELGTLLIEQRHVRKRQVQSELQLVELLTARSPPPPQLTPEERLEAATEAARDMPDDEIEAIVQVWCERHHHRLIVDDTGRLQIRHGGDLPLVP